MCSSPDKHTIYLVVFVIGDIKDHLLINYSYTSELPENYLCRLTIVTCVKPN